MENIIGLKKAEKLAKRFQMGLIRYRLVRGFVNYFIIKNKPSSCVYVWPPFKIGTDDINNFKILENGRHYLKKLNIDIEYFIESKNNIQRYSSKFPYKNSTPQGFVSINVAKKIIKNVRFCAIWKPIGIKLASSFRPTFYNVENGSGHNDVIEWLRLTSDIFEKNFGGPKNAFKVPPTKFNSCAVLGTGPSYEHFLENQYFHDSWIGANSIVCDERLLKINAAFAICIIDPFIFSANPSMKPTLEGLFLYLKKTSAVFITTKTLAAYVELNFPDELISKCYYSPALGRDSFNTKILSPSGEFTIIPYGNVLTDLMLPLASVISEKVVIYGCDGKDPKSIGNFEKSAAIELIDELQLEDIKKILDFTKYDAYIDRHNIFTKYVINECNKLGAKISIIKKSWNTGLQNLKIE